MTPIARAAARHGVHPAALTARPYDISAARHDAACELYAEGWTLDQIAELFHMSAPSVGNMLRRCGVKVRGRGGDQRGRKK